MYCCYFLINIIIIIIIERIITEILLYNKNLSSTNEVMPYVMCVCKYVQSCMCVCVCVCVCRKLQYVVFRITKSVAEPPSHQGWRPITPQNKFLVLNLPYLSYSVKILLSLHENTQIMVTRQKHLNRLRIIRYPERVRNARCQQGLTEFIYIS